VWVDLLEVFEGSSAVDEIRVDDEEDEGENRRYDDSTRNSHARCFDGYRLGYSVWLYRKQGEVGDHEEGCRLDHTV
jgi:hypothetical protein